MYVSGQVFTGDGFRQGYLGIEDGLIAETGSGDMAGKAVARGMVLPLLVNSHTHIGDSVVKGPVSGTIEELLAPPEGLKHRVLRESSDAEVMAAMRETIASMLHSGTGAFMEFREGGVRGLEQLEKALAGSPVQCLPMGRPEGLEYLDAEVDALLGMSAGVGVSAILDWEPPELSKLAAHVKRAGGLFALHVSERVREDMDTILGLDPDFVVHMVKATPSDMERCADAGIPVAVCPRSNAFFGNRTPVEEMMAAGMDIMLGTDNVMLNRPSLWEEMAYLYAGWGSAGIEPLDILKMATTAPRKVLNPSSYMKRGLLQEGSRADLLVVQASSEDPARYIVGLGRTPPISFLSVGGDVVVHP